MCLVGPLVVRVMTVSVSGRLRSPYSGESDDGYRGWVHVDSQPDDEDYSDDYGVYGGLPDS